MTMNIYLDNASTTRVAREAVSAMKPYVAGAAGNASSIHGDGVRAAVGVEKARAVIAERLNCSPDEVLFTSGGTESNNLAVKGRALLPRRTGGHVITTRIEHPSILEPVKWLRGMGFHATFLPVDAAGRIDPGDLCRAIRRNTVLVSIGHANHEIGVMQDIQALAGICSDRNICFHTDACQSFTKSPLDFASVAVSMISLNAHKIHGPKGVGALVLRKGSALAPLHHGGGQEHGLRSGTLNTAGIAGFGKAVELAHDSFPARMSRFRDRIIGLVEERIEGTRLTGPRGGERLCNHASFTVEGIRGKDLVLAMDKAGVTISSGSACSSGTEAPSHVLTAIGLSAEQAICSIRISISRFTTMKELDIAVDCLYECVKQLRRRPHCRPAGSARRLRGADDS